MVVVSVPVFDMVHVDADAAVRAAADAGTDNGTATLDRVRVTLDPRCDFIGKRFRSFLSEHMPLCLRNTGGALWLRKLS